MKAKLTPTVILLEVYRQRDWSFSKAEKEAIGFIDFKRIMNESELITYERTIKEKWRDLIDLGYFEQYGKKDRRMCTVNIPRIREKLGCDSDNLPSRKCESEDCIV